jgi:hypothetical protein
MDSRDQLRARRDALLARSAELRAMLMRDTEKIETKLHWIQPVAEVIGQFRQHKIATLIGLSNVVFGKRGRLAAIGASLLLAWWRRRAARRTRPVPPEVEAGAIATNRRGLGRAAGSDRTAAPRTGSPGK